MITELQFVNLCQKDYDAIALVHSCHLPPTLLAADIYEHIGNSPYSFLYESLHQKRHASPVSIIGIGALATFRVRQYQITHTHHDTQVAHINSKEPLSYIENYLQQYRAYIPSELKTLQHFHGGLAGYFGYESVCYHNKHLQQGLFLENPLDMDDVVLWQPETVLLIDRHHSRVTLISYVETSPSVDSEQCIDYYQQAVARLEALAHVMTQASSGSSLKQAHGETYEPKHTKSQAEFEAMVDRIIQYIYAGDAMQVVPAHRSTLAFDNSLAIPLYRQLARMSPSPHMFLLHTEDARIVGASPEVLVHMENNQVIIRPLAGTRARGANILDDKQLEVDLLSDQKEIAEHLMLIDLVRNDLGRIAEVGSVAVTEKMIVEKYAKVMHISSTVRATKTKNTSLFDVLATAHPAGTLSGAPKIRALEIIQELEQEKRIVYGGFIAMLGYNGNIDSAIAIRTGIIKDDQLHAQAGAGIVADSQPTTEWQEVCNKKSALLAAARTCFRA